MGELQTPGDSALDPLKFYLREVRRIPLLTADEERALGLRCKAGDRDAINEMVRRNLRLSIGYARKIGRFTEHLRVDDLIQEANISLIRAAETFDPDLGRFTTHASWWVRQGVLKARGNRDHSIRIPIHHQQAGLKPPHVAYLDAPVRNADSKEPAELGELLVNPDQLSPEHESILRDEFRGCEAQLRTLLALLKTHVSRRDAAIFVRRYGLDGSVSDGDTLEEVANGFGVTRERVRQVCARNVWPHLVAHGCPITDESTLAVVVERLFRLEAILDTEVNLSVGDIVVAPLAHPLARIRNPTTRLLKCPTQNRWSFMCRGHAVGRADRFQIEDWRRQGLIRIRPTHDGTEAVLTLKGRKFCADQDATA